MHRMLLALVASGALTPTPKVPEQQPRPAMRVRRREKIATGPLTAAELARVVWAQCMRDYHAGSTEASADLEALLADALASGAAR
jgi:hypothetical protein